MIGFAGTNGTAPKWLSGNIIKPGYGDPKPPEHVSTRDKPENVQKCLNCAVKGGCRPESKDCQLRVWKGGGKKAAETLEREKKVLKLLKSGWINIDAICEELGISRDMYFKAKRRLKGKGLI